MAQDIASDFAEKFREVGIAEFFRRNMHMLGYSGPIRSLTTVIHEFVTNSLDACEEYGILPEIEVRIKELGEKHYIVSVKDNGPGIPVEFIPKVFGSMLAGTKFHRYIQSRGQQGIGAVGAILFSQMTTGKPVKIQSSIGDGWIYTLIMKINVEKNQAIVLDMFKTPGEWRGTKIVAEYKQVLYNRSEQGAYEYLRRTAIVNPHATIILHEPNGTRVIWKRSVESLPGVPKEMKPHPLGLLADDLLRMARRSKARKLGTFLQKELSRVSEKKAREVLSIARVRYEKDPDKLTYAEAERIINAFKQVKLLAPPTEGLIPVGAEILEKSLKNVLKPSFVKAITRKPTVYRGGIPFQVEVAIAWGGGAGRGSGEGKKLEIMRFANKAPLLFDSGACALTKAVNSIDWRSYRVENFPDVPMTVLINIISPHVPYLSAGKQAVADDPDIVKELRLALMEAARSLRLYLSGVARAKIQEKKKSIFKRYIPEVATALSILTGKKAEEIEKYFFDFLEKKFALIKGGEEEVQEVEVPSAEERGGG